MIMQHELQGHGTGTTALDILKGRSIASKSAQLSNQFHQSQKISNVHEFFGLRS